MRRTITRKPNKKRSKRGVKRDNQPRNGVPLAVMQPSFAGEICRTEHLPGPNQLVTTTGTSFAIVYPIGNLTTQVLDFTDFANRYDQYTIFSAKIEIMCLTPPTPGAAMWFFDSSANANVPVVADEARDGVLITNHSMNVNRKWRRTFRVKDPSLLSFRNTTVDYVVGYFKAFTNLANFGTSATNTLLYRYRVIYEVRFRGRKV